MGEITVCLRRSHVRRLSSVDRLLIATHNPGKLAEMRELIMPYGHDVVSAGELGLPEPEENGASFRDNARIKAIAAARASGLPAFADDSGLAVDALGGAPGIHSARWAGPQKDFAAAMRRVEDDVRATGNANRRAHFVAALCLAWPDGHVEDFEAAHWYGRRAATRVLDTIRCSCRMATRGPSARWMPTRSTAFRRAEKACRIARARS
jgi:non-canonical purine NTP pyrophosphatase (RdgB/HAM1 family)